MPDSERGRLYKNGRVWCVACGNCGGVFPTYERALDALRYYLRHAR